VDNTAGLFIPPGRARANTCKHSRITYSRPLARPLHIPAKHFMSTFLALIFWLSPKPERASNFLSLVIPTFKIRLPLQLLAFHPFAVKGACRDPRLRNCLSDITSSRVTHEFRPHAPITSSHQPFKPCYFPMTSDGNTGQLYRPRISGRPQCIVVRNYHCDERGRVTLPMGMVGPGFWN
jgi:hypothetical protein